MQNKIRGVALTVMLAAAVAVSTGARAQKPIIIIKFSHVHEVQKYLALTEHGVIEYAVSVNKKFWDGLPPDVRAALESAMADATKYANDIAKKENDDALEGVRKSGKTEILTLTAAERTALNKVKVTQ
jgi:C4-dicarboxylate-binding protein DctP